MTELIPGVIENQAQPTVPRKHDPKKLYPWLYTPGAKRTQAFNMAIDEAIKKLQSMRRYGAGTPAGKEHIGELTGQLKGMKYRM